jgi:hypothetical protein
MTYKEAQDFIADNWKELRPSLLDSKPPHIIKREFIAPTQTELNTLINIFILSISICPMMKYYYK